MFQDLRFNISFADALLLMPRFAPTIKIVPAGNVSAGHVLLPAGSSSSVPADYVSAGHVLVPADRDRIC
ncbi:hypothetical protein Tco_1322848 [Tanacetum coccineum]